MPMDQGLQNDGGNSYLYNDAQITSRRNLSGAARTQLAAHRAQFFCTGWK
jgi:hypothetical protein